MQERSDPAGAENKSGVEVRGSSSPIDDAKQCQRHTSVRKPQKDFEAVFPRGNAVFESRGQPVTTNGEVTPCTTSHIGMP